MDSNRSRVFRGTTHTFHMPRSNSRARGFCGIASCASSRPHHKVMFGCGSQSQYRQQPVRTSNNIVDHAKFPFKNGDTNWCVLKLRNHLEFTPPCIDHPENTPPSMYITTRTIAMVTGEGQVNKCEVKGQDSCASLTGYHLSPAARVCKALWQATETLTSRRLWYGLCIAKVQTSLYQPTT